MGGPVCRLRNRRANGSVVGRVRLRDDDKERDMGRTMTASLAMALALGGLAGCAGGGGRVAELEAGGLGAVQAIYNFAQTPAWTAKAEPGVAPGEVRIEMERSMFVEGGDGAASMAFRMAAKKWCAERGARGFLILEFAEFYEARLLGAARRASGEARCS